MFPFWKTKNIAKKEIIIEISIDISKTEIYNRENDC
jgi:hypothetical protein|nr:MAG TPA: hypothetical protein [Caudoviricetes sp.]